MKQQHLRFPVQRSSKDVHQLCKSWTLMLRCHTWPAQMGGGSRGQCSSGHQHRAGILISMLPI